jgi:hypothetical protein
LSHMTCPQCGAALYIDVLTREPRPCTACGATYSLDSPERPQPDVEHQQTINRQKYFEIAAVMIMILVGFGYLALSINNREARDATEALSHDLSSILEVEGYEAKGTSNIQGQRFETFIHQSAVLRTTIDLVTLGDSATHNHNAFIIAVSLPEGQTVPPVAVIEPAVQEAFNAISLLGEELLPRSTPSLQKAVATTAPISNSPVDHLKGVAQTNSGWKITYINYREVQGTEFETPFLLFVYQELNAASNSDFETFHKALYKALSEGQEIKRVFNEHKTGPTDGQ